ncbi:MAG: DUF2268 domain-containing putative Zn-dependent protease [Dokdonella sp.]|uniref:DUF2268 domain-containing putative Zn-dependent protease n=1 Tax=Dokdonella sp. TaxID=2291710 RepID=UPI003F7E88FA
MNLRPCAIILALAVTASLPASASNTQHAVVRTDDVALFYRVYDAAGGHPSADQLQHEYLDVGSVGLHELARQRDVTGARIAGTLAKRPAIYADAKRCMAVLPRVRERLESAIAKLAELHPASRLPPVTIAIGRGKPVGIGSPATGVQIGLEALCATDWLNPDVEERFVTVIAHEYAHTQQAPALAEKEHPTVLEGSLAEGAAEFVAELIAGHVSYDYLAAITAGREKAVETAFAADVDKTDLTDWLYNSKADRPADLGYWVGYRIVKAYYQHARDKREALHATFAMTDAHAFLAASGWYPGIELR